MNGTSRGVHVHVHVATNLVPLVFCWGSVQFFFFGNILD